LGVGVLLVWQAGASTAAISASPRTNDLKAFMAVF